MNRREAQAEVSKLSQEAEEIRHSIEGELECEPAASLERWLEGQAHVLDTVSERPCLDEDMVCAAHICWRVRKLDCQGPVKPFEIVKIALHGHGEARFTHRALIRADPAAMPSHQVRIAERTVDRLIFNRNYWRDAYWSRIVRAVGPKSAPSLLNALSVDRCVSDELTLIDKGTNLNLHRMTQQEVIDEFERSCPPFGQNRRRGIHGPVVDYLSEVERISDPRTRNALAPITHSILAELARYDALRARRDAFGCFYELLPAWCLTQATGLFRADLWDSRLSLAMLIDLMSSQFSQWGFEPAVCKVYEEQAHKAFAELILWTSAEDKTPLAKAQKLQQTELDRILDILQNAKHAEPRYETRGYPSLPRWLIAKEQVVWNAIACAVYGPHYVRPKLLEAGETAPMEPIVIPTREDIEIRHPLSSGMGIITLEHLYGELNTHSGVFSPSHIQQAASIDLGMSKADTTTNRLVVVLGRELHLGAPRRQTARFSTGSFTYSEARSKHYATRCALDSSRHAALFLIEGSLILKDLDSKNGTIVWRGRGSDAQAFVMPGRNARLRQKAEASDGRLRVVSEVLIHLGDVIRLGGSWFRIV